MKKFSEMSELELRMEMVFPHTDQELEEIDRELRKYGKRLPFHLRPEAPLIVAIPALIVAVVSIVLRVLIAIGR